MEIVFVVCHACDGTIARENEKRKYLKIFIPLFLRRCIHRQSSCLSISSNFIWYTTYVCDFFSSSSPSCFAFFFLAFHFSALSAGNCVWIYFEISAECLSYPSSHVRAPPLFAITFLHSKSMAWGVDGGMWSSYSRDA